MAAVARLSSNNRCAAALARRRHKLTWHAFHSYCLLRCRPATPSLPPLPPLPVPHHPNWVVCGKSFCSVTCCHTCKQGLPFLFGLFGTSCQFLCLAFSPCHHAVTLVRALIYFLIYYHTHTTWGRQAFSGTHTPATFARRPCTRTCPLCCMHHTHTPSTTYHYTTLPLRLARQQHWFMPLQQ